MKINKYKAISAILVVLVLLTILGNVFQIRKLSEIAWISILPTLLVFYSMFKNKKDVFFIVFLIGFALSEIFKLWFITSEFIYYNLSNFSIIIGYISLLIFFFKGMNLKVLFKKFKFHILILSIFNVYILYTLNQMILHDPTLKIDTLSFFMEVVYNVLILMLLSVSLMYYLYNESKQALLLFLASVCIVFSEMIQVAYVFISAEIFLRIGYLILMAIGFGFIYFYTLLEVKNKNYITQ